MVHTVSGEPIGSMVSIFTWVCGISSDDGPDKLASHMNGTGYYKMNKYENDTLYLEANEDYWGGAPKIKKVEWKYVSDASTRLAAIQTGGADFTERIESEQIPSVLEYKDLEVVQQQTLELKQFIFKFGTGTPIDNEVKVRRAIAYAIDRDTIINDIMGVLGTKVENCIAPATWSYAPVPEEYQYNYDPEKAAQLLEEAGYPGGKGLPEIYYISSTGFYPKTKEYGEYIVSCLSEVGFKVKFDPMETSSWNDVLYQKASCDAIDSGFTCTLLDPDQKLLLAYYSGGVMSQIDDPELNEVLEKEARMIDENERKTYLQETVYPAIASKVCDVPLFNSVLLYVVNDRIKNVKIGTTTAINLHDAYFE